MSRGWTVGRLAGVDIRIHPTFLVIVAMAVLGLLGPPAEGLTWLALVFSCVISHELAHALVARRRGLVVRDIVLLPIGGASEIEELPARPDDELAVALAGPISSLGLGGLLLLFGWLARGSVASPSLLTGGIVDRLAWTNVMLGTFNLLPALPMDGGRVLRAALAEKVGMERATVQASAISRRVAVALAAAGLLVMPWLLVIALFVYVSGRAEEAGVLLHARLAGLVVRDLMVPLGDPHGRPVELTVRDDEPVEDAVQRMAAAGHEAATVVDADGTVVGVLLLERVAALVRQGR